MKKITLGSRQYGFVAGTNGFFIVTNDEFIHRVYKPGESAELSIGKAFEVEYKSFSLADLEAAPSEPLSLFEFGHYWGVKQRMAGNYSLLLKSMREIKADTKSMPKWGEDDRPKEQAAPAEPKPCRECGNRSYHQRDCSKSNYEDTGNDTIIRNEDREEG